MKIDPKIIQGADLTGKTPASPKKETGSSSFDSLLSESISEKRTTADKTVPVTDMPDVMPTTSISQDSFVRTTSVEKLEKLFNMMDMYQNALNNPKIGIQRLEGSLDEMISISKEAIELMAYLPPEDGLRDIISESAATVMTESQLYHSLKRSN